MYIAEGQHEKSEALKQLVFSSFSKVADFLYADMSWKELDAELEALNRELRTRILPSLPSDEPKAFRAFQKANDTLFYLKRGDKGYREAAQRHWLAVATCLRRANVEFGVAQADQNRAVPCVLVPDAVLEQAMQALEGTLTRSPPASLKILNEGQTRPGDNALAKEAQRFAVAYLKASKKGLTGDRDPITTICEAYEVTESALDVWVKKFRKDTFSFPETLQFIADREEAAEQLTTAHPHLRPKPGEQFNVFAFTLRNYAHQYRQNRRPPSKEGKKPTRVSNRRH